MIMTEIKTKEEAINKAIEWQNWAFTQSLSYSKILEWQEYFSELANRFDLVEEFSENGIV